MQQIQAFINIINGIVYKLNTFVIFFAVAKAYGLHTGFLGKF